MHKECVNARARQRVETSAGNTVASKLHDEHMHLSCMTHLFGCCACRSAQVLRRKSVRSRMCWWCDKEIMLWILGHVST
jgi:hypothetical protein